MIPLLLAYLSYPQLGHPAYPVREAAHRRCDCLLGAVFAPVGHPDPEIRLRAERIRSRWLGRLAGRWAEYVAFRRADGDPDGLVQAIQSAPADVRERFLVVHPLPAFMGARHLKPPLVPSDGPEFRRHVGHERACAAGGGLLGGGW